MLKKYDSSFPVQSSDVLIESKLIDKKKKKKESLKIHVSWK